MIESCFTINAQQLAKKPQHIAVLEQWMKGYRPEELFDDTGSLVAEVAALAPTGERRMGSNPHANGGLPLRDLKLPDYREYAVEVPTHGSVDGEATRKMVDYLRDVITLNARRQNLSVMDPDESVSSRFGALLEVTDRSWEAETCDYDDHLAPDGRVMEILSEHSQDMPEIRQWRWPSI